jgi:hypothetical protein
VCHFQRRCPWHSGGVSNDSEAMVLGGDQHLISADTTYGVIASPVSIREFGSGASVGQPDQLMSQADTERRKAGAGQLSY